MDSDFLKMVAEAEQGCIVYAPRYFLAKPERAGAAPEADIAYYGPFVTVEEALDFLDDHELMYYLGVSEGVVLRQFVQQEDVLIELDGETEEWQTYQMFEEDQHGYTITMPFYPLDLRADDAELQLASFRAVCQLVGFTVSEHRAD